jgi:hypothetical protein
MVNFTSNGDFINLTANRDSYFWIKGTSYQPYIQLNTIPVSSIEVYYRNITNTTAIQWMGNDTFGESMTGMHSKDVGFLFNFILGIVWEIGFAWWLPAWSWWFIIPIGFGILVVFPLGVNFLIYMYMRSREMFQGGGGNQQVIIHRGESVVGRKR